MVSEKQLEANRQNAIQSTGPSTDNGIEAVKLNALRHDPGVAAVNEAWPRPPEAVKAGIAAMVNAAVSCG
jgi:hypothetical protein